MNFYIDVLSLTCVSAGVWEAYDLIGFDNLKVTAADVPVKGLAKSPSTAAGQSVAVVVIGSIRVKAVGAITAGQRVVSAAAGGVQFGGATPANPIGRAVNTVADGEFVEVIFNN
jgi:hypothetical protein